MKTFCTICVAIVAALGGLGAAPLAPSSTQPATQPTTAPSPAELDERIERGLAFLAAAQRADGSFHADERPGPAAESSSLAILAFLSCGQLSDVGRHGLAVRAAVDDLLRRAPADGDFRSLAGGSATTQALATLALGQLTSAEHDAARQAQLGALLRKSTAVLAQVMKDDSTDLPATAWGLAALRVAANRGVDVPDSAFTAGVRRIPALAANNASADTAAAAMLGLASSGPADRPELAGIRRVVVSRPADAAMTLQSRCMLLYAINPADSDFQASVWPVQSRAILRLQAADGGWRDNDRPRVSATATAILALGASQNLMPR